MSIKTKYLKKYIKYISIFLSCLTFLSCELLYPWTVDVAKFLTENNSR